LRGILSAIPALHGHALLVCLITLSIITLINLRGLRGRRCATPAAR
jgi:hypothetical protein